MNKLLVCSFRYVVIIIVLFLLLTTNSKLITVYAHTNTQVVEMTEDGFIPSEVIIDQNQAVIFINKDTKPRWPASNTHPIHELYPEFDPKKAINIGASWPFKPKVGEWKVHDHLNSHLRGILKVIAEPGSKTAAYEQNKNVVVSWIQNLRFEIASFFSRILNSFGPKLVLDKAKFQQATSNQQIEMLKKYADQDSAEKVWEFVKKTYKDQGGSSGNIHDLAHLSGGLLYKQLGFAGLAKCSADFAFGCYHGFLDTAFAKNLDHLLDAQDACLKLGPDGSGPVGSCIHGIGHGIASFHLTADLKVSLADCRKLTSGRDFCFDGVFMEFVRSAPDSFYNKEKPLFPCDWLEDQFGYVYSQACGRNQPPLLMGRFKMDFEEVIKTCLESDSDIFKKACFDSLGFSLASGTVDQIVYSCQTIGEEEYVITCLKSAAGELIFQDRLGWDKDSKEICNATPLKGQQQCFDHINRIILDYGRKPN